MINIISNILLFFPNSTCAQPNPRVSFFSAANSGYLANKGFKVSNIPLVNENSVPDLLKKNTNKNCIVGLTAEPERLIEIRKNRISSLKETRGTNYIDLQKIQDEVEKSKKTFQKNKWPIIDVSRKSVEETAASVIKIYEISKKNA